MVLKNKKGDLMLDIISVVLILVIYFNSYEVLDAITIEMLSLNPDSLTGWFLRGITFFIMLGILRWVLVISDTGGMQQ